MNDSTNPPTSVERPQYDAIVRMCLSVHIGAKTDAWNRSYDEWGGLGASMAQTVQKMAVVP